MNRWRWLALVLALMLVVAACGGDDDDADDDGGDTATTAAADAGGDEGAASGEDVTLRVLIHSQEPMNSWVQDFSRQFEADNPGVTVDVSIVAADAPPRRTNFIL